MSKYSVDPTVVRPVLVNTRNAIGEYASADEIQQAFVDALAALPTEYGEAHGGLDSVKGAHVRDYSALVTYATTCVDAVSAAMDIYAKADADMVAQEREIHNKIKFDSPWGGGNLESGLGAWGAWGRSRSSQGTNSFERSRSGSTSTGSRLWGHHTTEQTSVSERSENGKTNTKINTNASTTVGDVTTPSAPYREFSSETGGWKK